jgi:hypothetical protein
LDARNSSALVYHPEHSLAQICKLLDWCDRYGLIPTGGSDYHGPNASAMQEEATHLNQFHLPLTMLAPIQVAAQSHTSSPG